jgi:hypothetical protein
MILAYIPDVNLKTLIPEYNKRWNEKYIWALHSICYQQLRNKSTFNSYANINLALLQKYIGSKYSNYILTQLLNAKIIEPYVNDKGVQSYVAGAFSKAYRINPEIMASTRIKATPIRKKTFARKITNVRSELIKEAVKLNPHLQHELLMLTNRKIRYKEAYEYIKATYEPHTPQYKARVMMLNEFNEMHKASLTQGKELLPFHFSYIKGRVYSPASMLPRDLERFTYFVGYEKEASICLDMPNSQLCFFDELVKRSVFKDKHASKSIGESDTRESDTKKVHNIGREERKEIRGNEERPTLPTLPKNNTKNISPLINPLHHSLCYELSNGKNSWKTFIRRGYGYEIMMKHFNWKDKAENHTKQERQEFKEIFFGQLFYNRYIHNYLTPLEKVFKEHFSIEAENLRTIKRQLGNKLLAVQVQTLEGKFFHDICVKYIKANYKSVPFTIKHDSITLPQSEASYLISELNQLVKDFFKDSQMGFKVETL